MKKPFTQFLEQSGTDMVRSGYERPVQQHGKAWMPCRPSAGVGNSSSCCSRVARYTGASAAPIGHCQSPVSHGSFLTHHAGHCRRNPSRLTARLPPAMAAATSPCSGCLWAGCPSCSRNKTCCLSSRRLVCLLCCQQSWQPAHTGLATQLWAVPIHNPSHRRRRPCYVCYICSCCCCHCCQFGDVKDIIILKDKVTGQPRGCAFVSYATKDEAEAAIGALDKGVHLPGALCPMEVSASGTCNQTATQHGSSTQQSLVATHTCSARSLSVNCSCMGRTT